MDPLPSAASSHCGLNQWSSTTKKWVAIALLVSSLVIFGGMAAFGGVGIWAVKSSLPHWLAHVIGTVSQPGQIAFLSTGAILCALGCIVSVSLFVKAKHKPPGNKNRLDEDPPKSTIPPLPQPPQAPSHPVQPLLTGPYTELHACAFTGSKEGCERILSKGKININAPDTAGNTALHLAVAKNHFDLVDYLCSCDGININSQDQYGKTPFFNAVYARNFPMIKLLLSNDYINPNLPDENGVTPFWHAVKSGSIDIISVLIQSDKIDVNRQTEGYFSTPLHYAVGFHKDTEMVKILLPKADRTLTNDRGLTPTQIPTSEEIKALFSPRE